MPETLFGLIEEEEDSPPQDKRGMVPLLYRRHHPAHHWIPPYQWTLRRATRKNPVTTRISPKHYYGTLQRIIIPKIRRTRSGKHSRKLCLMPRLRAHPQSYPRSLDAQHWRTSPFSPPKQHRCRREILVALCVLVSFRCVLYGLVVIWTNS
ncbi:hypothetical protein PVAP13_1NG330200 [Panicum virgatum]|uniref:Uncharacterized protein n=1 Tax=Panicum virgatum TaxID=38727 RepID=A0A8T0WW36_PANVG|nr:hypothetical protein PVAP13_1NG330200 [Panicum virgatum]